MYIFLARFISVAYAAYFLQAQHTTELKFLLSNIEYMIIHDDAAIVKNFFIINIIIVVIIVCSLHDLKALDDNDT